MVTNKRTGEIKFNPHLTFNDGALAGYIANEEGINKIEAQNKVAKFTSEIKATVDKGETYDILNLVPFIKTKMEIWHLKWPKIRPKKLKLLLKKQPPKKQNQNQNLQLNLNYFN